MTLKQTKQVLKDTTWALTVKEEELKNIKVDMRDNYEGRLSELILRLNDRELKLSSMTQERNAFADEKRDLQLRVDELTQQVGVVIICYSFSAVFIRTRLESLCNQHRQSACLSVSQSVRQSSHTSHH